MSELLGSMEGSYTGAEKDYSGQLEDAGDGVLFLDDIHHLSKAAQAALLSPLQDRVFRRMHGKSDIQFRARVVSATNMDLVQLCKEGVLPEEFYNRIAKFTLSVPALAQRPRDVELIAKGLSAVPSNPPRLTTDALRALQAYSWPGNIRQLESVISHICTFYAGEEVALPGLRNLEIAYLGQTIEWGAVPGLASEWDVLLCQFGWDRGWAELRPEDSARTVSWLGQLLMDVTRVEALQESLKSRPSPKPIHFLKALLFASLCESVPISHKMLEEVLGLGWDFTNKVGCFLSGISNDGRSGFSPPFLLRENKNGKYVYALAPGILRTA